MLLGRPWDEALHGNTFPSEGVGTYYSRYFQQVLVGARPVLAASARGALPGARTYLQTGASAG